MANFNSCCQLVTGKATKEAAELARAEGSMHDSDVYLSSIFRHLVGFTFEQLYCQAVKVFLKQISDD